MGDSFFILHKEAGGSLPAQPMRGQLPWKAGKGWPGSNFDWHANNKERPQQHVGPVSGPSGWDGDGLRNSWAEALGASYEVRNTHLYSAFIKGTLSQQSK